MAGAAPLPALHGTSILIIEDNDEVREAMEAALQLCGARTIPGASLAEARTLLAAEPPHIVVSDFVLPDGTGSDFLEWLRELPADRGGALAVVAVTAFPHYVSPARSKGFAAYLVKPVDLDDLCWTIAGVLGRGTRGAPAP